MLAITLQDDNIETEIAGTGKAALEMLEKDDFDLMLLDLGLPDIDGLEVLEKLRNSRKIGQLPVIVITGREKMRDKVKAFELGAVDYINKPINFLDVQARIVATLRRNETQSAVEKEVTKDLQRTQEELLRISKAVDCASDAVCVLDATQAVSYVNGSFVTLFGVNGEDLEVEGCFSRLFVEQREWDEIWGVCEENGSFAGDLDMRAESGESLIVHCRADAVLNEGSSFLGTVILFTDIRQR